MRLITRIPASRGIVRAVTVQLRYDGDAGADAVDVTDVQLQPGDPTGVVPHPSDVAIRTGGARYRNGVITRSEDEIIVLSNDDRAAPTTLSVAPSAVGTVRVGSFRFGRIVAAASADGRAGTATTGWGRVPVLTERCDGHFAVATDRPIHLTVGWSERS